MKMLRLQVFANVCDTCGLEFESLSQTEDYGEVIYDNGNGVVQFLDPAGPVWQEVSALVDKVNHGRPLSKMKRAELFHQALPRSIDAPPNGAFGSAWTKPPCRRCGSRRRAFFGPMTPPVFREVCLDEVTHERWKSLGAGEKISEVTDAMTQS